MKMFAKFLTASTLVLSALHAYAAVPPLTEKQRMALADLIVEGTVVKVEEKEIQLPPPQHEFSNYVYDVDLAVGKIVKGPDITAGIIHFTYWKKHKRPSGWGGPQGQNSKIEDNTSVRVYLKDELSGLELLAPNGFENLDVVVFK